MTAALLIPDFTDRAGRTAPEAPEAEAPEAPEAPNERTAPPIVRRPMPTRPWFGAWRGLLIALMPGLRFAAPPPTRAWQGAARRRRRVLLAWVLGTAVAAAWGLVAGGVPGAGSSAWAQALWWAHAGLAVLLLAWLSAGAATALMGVWVLLRGDRHALAAGSGRGESGGQSGGEGGPAPLSRQARTAVVMPICNEDIATVFAGLRATCESVAASGALALFDFYVLSDSSRPEVRTAELAAWRKLRADLGDGALPKAAGGGQAATGARLFYRWRQRRTRKKAGNVADFCRRWGAHYRYMVVLDADSTMQGDTLVALVRLMEQHPQAGIIQTLPQASGAHTLHARVQQFAARVTGRLFALGMAYWQLGDSHYWGHNAILRVEPFMRHCGLAPLPGRGGMAGEILSHDFVEAALMRRAGYEVWLAPQLAGSWEQNPPHLLDEMQRDRRWCQGNLQNARLVLEPGWQPAHRAMFVVGALSYAVAPLWLLFVLLGLASGAALESSAADAASSTAVWLWPLTLALLLLPRALGVAAVLGARQAQRYGGEGRLVASALLEGAVATLQAPVRMLAHSHFVLSAVLGSRLSWKSPLRDAQAVAWRDALARTGTLVAPLALLLSLMALLPARRTSAAQLLPLLAAMLLAVPLTWATAHPRLSQWLRQRGWLGTPEEREPPHTLVRAADQRGFLRLAAAAAAGGAPAGGAVAAVPAAVPAAEPASASAPPRASARPAPRASAPSAWRPLPRWHGALAGGLAAAAIAMVAPEQALTPELSAAQRATADLASQALAWAELEMRAPAELQPAAAPDRALRDRPARMIDEGVRRRAREAVRRALEQEAELEADPRAWQAPNDGTVRRG